MVLFLLLFSTSIAFAQSLPPVISITPAEPTQSDLLHIRIDTNNICYPPPGDGIVATVSGATIQIVATLTCTALTTPPPPFTFGRDVGPLSAGLYQVQYLARLNGGVPTVLATASVQVRSSVTPNPSYAGEKLRFSKVLPGGLCYDQIQIQNISTSGNEVTVAYTITAIPPMACGLSPPVVLDAVIGPFTPGQYTARGIGDYHGTPLAPFVEPFTVLPAPSPLKSYQGLWWNAPAGSESGWGLNLAHQGNVLFATWFTYDLTGKAWWLAMTAAKVADNTYSGTLFQTSGPAFDAVPFPPLGSPGGAIGSSVGSATLAFSDLNNGTFAYTVNGISQTKAITRQLFGVLPDCIFEPQFDAERAANLTDLWWAAPSGSEAGWGLNITEQTSSPGYPTLFGTWFTYDHDRTPMWLSVTATFDTSSGKFRGDLYRTHGPPFNSVPFPSLGSPGGVTGSVVGSASFINNDGDTKTFTYTLNGVTQTKSITRQVFGAPRAVCTYPTD
jgi:hypothetical protein